MLFAATGDRESLRSAVQQTAGSRPSRTIGKDYVGMARIIVSARRSGLSDRGDRRRRSDGAAGKSSASRGSRRISNTALSRPGTDSPTVARSPAGTADIWIRDFGRSHVPFTFGAGDERLPLVSRTGAASCSRGPGGWSPTSLRRRGADRERKRRCSRTTCQVPHSGRAMAATRVLPADPKNVGTSGRPDFGEREDDSVVETRRRPHEANADGKIPPVPVQRSGQRGDLRRSGARGLVQVSPGSTDRHGGPTDGDLTGRSIRGHAVEIGGGSDFRTDSLASPGPGQQDHAATSRPRDGKRLLGRRSDARQTPTKIA